VDGWRRKKMGGWRTEAFVWMGVHEDGEAQLQQSTTRSRRTSDRNGNADRPWRRHQAPWMPTWWKPPSGGDLLYADLVAVVCLREASAAAATKIQQVASVGGVEDAGAC
jgi:hypothetical protein